MCIRDRCIGYFEADDNRFLIIYDNNYPDCIVIWRVYEDYIDAFSLGKQKRLEVVRLTEEITKMELLKLIKGNIIYVYQRLRSLFFRCPIDIIINSEAGIIKVINDQVVENSINDSYVYASMDVKIILLPSDLNYDIEVYSRGEQQLNITLTQLVDNTISFYDYTISVTISSVLTFSLESDKPPQEINADLDGDGTIDTKIEPKRNEARVNPTISIIYPEEGAIIKSNTVDVRWEIKPGFYSIVKVIIRLDDGPWIDVTNKSHYTFTGVSGGEHTIIIRLIDESDKITEDSVSFMVETAAAGPFAWINDRLVEILGNIPFIKDVIALLETFIPGYGALVFTVACIAVIIIIVIALWRRRKEKIPSWIIELDQRLRRAGYSRS